MTTIVPADANPTGSYTTQTDLFVEGGPEFYFGGVLRYAPDSNGYYWGLQGTTENPLYKVGCYVDFRLRDNLQSADIRCDTSGMRASIQKRNFLEVSFNLLTMFPLSMMSKFVARTGNGIPVTNPGYTLDPTNHTEQMGFGEVDNNTFYLAFFSKIYDATSGDFLSFTGHHCQFVDMTEIAFTYGQPYAYRVVMRMYADITKPSLQRFATVLRYDPTRL